MLLAPDWFGAGDGYMSGQEGFSLVSLFLSWFTGDWKEGWQHKVL